MKHVRMTVVISFLGLASLLLISTALLFADTQNEAPVALPEEIKALIEKPGPQIEIECKFVEINRGTGLADGLILPWQDDPQQWLQEQLQAGKAQVINMPRVTTRNGIPGKVEFTTDVPYFYATITYNEFGQRTVDYETDTVSVVESISVTPTLQADGQILMDIDFRIDQQRGTVTGPDGGVIPIVSTQSGSTQARTADGEPLVIGGLAGTKAMVKPKFLPSGESLQVGELFKTRAAAGLLNTERLIFVTPKVIGSTSPVVLPAPGVISGEIRDGEQWVWDKIDLRYLEATHVAGMFGGQIVTVAPDGPVKTEELTARAKPPQELQVGAITLPMGMDPPLAVVEHNILIVHGTQEAIDQFREILAFFDEPTKLIEIEARFVEVDVQEGKAFGIDWFVANGSAEFFNLGFKPGQGLNVARFRRGRFESELRTLLSEGRAQVINAPRVTTRNNLPATVDFAPDIPCGWAKFTADARGNRTVQRHEETVSVRYSLTVTPRILEDNTVVLDLEPEVHSPTGTVVGPEGEVLPIVSSQSVYTRVHVGDGDTIVIGGFTRTIQVPSPDNALPPEEPAAGGTTK